MSAELLKRGNESYLYSDEIQRSPTVLYYILRQNEPELVFKSEDVFSYQSSVLIPATLPDYVPMHSAFRELAISSSQVI